MIIQSCILTAQKKCEVPIKYKPTREAFDHYAHYYMKEPQELYDEVAAVANASCEEDDISSEEVEDNEIKETDRIAVALISEDNEPRLDTYVLDKETDAFYVHHDVFLHGVPTGLAVSDRNEEPLSFVASEDGTIAIYRIFVTNQFLPDGVIVAHEGRINSITADTVNILTNSSEEIKLWDINTQKNIFTHKRQQKAIAMKDSFVYFSDNSSVYMIDTRDKTEINLFSADSEITSISSDRNSVAAGTINGSITYSINQSKEKSFKIHGKAINNVCASMDRYIVSASQDETISLFDMQNGEIVERKAAGVDTVTVSIPSDTVNIYTYANEDGDLSAGSFEDALLRIE
ncbi:hypothetical protein NERG_01553 [Nematocida ausubeli]|uniref:Anaphase-promoting complex subunit 4 WD40 domain-containing protein n=1 Tax=Nematocida ausubeli (strain ATCC PRA-371 / ERTm2) TaxID=1913371 RepID=H8ZD82_NEMA1|nr:hypothetical protein NERG_01553 [Nematocida ausubeli]